MSKKSSLSFFIGMSIVGALLIVLYACITGNQNQTFTDVVIEYTSRCDANKTAERNMFYIFPIVGAIIYAIAFFKNKWDKPVLSDTAISSKSILITTLVVSIAVNYAVYQKTYIVVLAALAVVVAAHIKNESLVVPMASTYFLLVYGFIGIYRALTFLGVRFNTNITILSLIAAVFCFITIAITSNEKYIYRIQLITQLFIPFTLLMYLLSKYRTVDEQIFTINTPKRVQAVIYVLIVAFVIETIVKINKSWYKAESLQDVLSYGTVVAIMTFNRYSGTGSISDYELHHAYENVIGFSQVFELGQKLFSEYIPVSGMYSMLHGFVFWFFGHGLGGFYYVCTNLYFLFIILAIAFLLRKQFKAEWVLLLSLLFLVKDYNRVALIAPIVLLLTWPALIEKKNLWLKAWFLTSFVHGLYYPIFGAAVALGFMPLAIWQIVTYAKSGELKKDVKEAKFWIYWGLCLVPPLAGIKLLLGTAKHILAMGSQTIYADGIARFGQTIPADFFEYIPYLPVRIVLYYLASYWVVICILWVSAAFCLKLRKGNPVAACIAIAIAIILLVSFSYTVVRFDIGDIYSRTDGSIRVAVVLLLLVLSRYISKNDKSYRWILMFAILVTSIVSGEAVNTIDSDSKLSAYYAVPENDIYAEDTNIRLGKAFINADTYTYISNINNYVKSMDTNQSYLGIADSFGLFYFCDIKGGSVMEIFNTIKGYSATEETVELLRNNHSIVGRNINPDSNYYFYHWLMTSGEYIWDDNLRCFVPNDGSKSYKDVVNAHKFLDLNFPDARQLAYTCSCWGQSMEDLQDIFTDPGVGVSVNGNTLDFNRTFEGNEADFLYIEFEGLNNEEFYYLHDGDESPIDVSKYGLFKNLFKKNYNQGMTVTVSWIDESGTERRVFCLIDEGKLLIPVGSGAGWYFNQHNQLNVTVFQYGEPVENATITSAKMLKLREVK